MADKSKPEIHPNSVGAGVPSVFVNRFNLAVGPITTRIVLGEVVVAGTEATYHNAVVMVTSDAIELANLILKLVEQNKKLSS